MTRPATHPGETLAGELEEKNLEEKNKPGQSELPPIEQIMGMLKPDGPMFSDEDVEEILYQRLAEKS